MQFASVIVESPTKMRLSKNPAIDTKGMGSLANESEIHSSRLLDYESTTKLLEKIQGIEAQNLDLTRRTISRTPEGF